MKLRMKNGKANGDFDWNDHHHLSVVLLPACLPRPTNAGRKCHKIIWIHFFTQPSEKKNI
jgi:hypothetical protein